MCFSISRHFSFRFLVCQHFCAFFSLHDHDCSISHLHSYAFHTHSYISCNKIHKILAQNKYSKQGEFQVSYTKSSFLYSLCMSQPEETWVKKKFTTISRPSDFQSFHHYCIVQWIIAEVKWEFLIHTAHTEVSAW